MQQQFRKGALQLWSREHKIRASMVSSNFQSVLLGLSDKGVMELHRVYCEGWPKFGLEIHLVKRDYINDFMIMRIPRAFEKECEAVLKQLQIKLP